MAINNVTSHAIDLLKRHCVSQFPVCPMTIAEQEGILCQPMGLSATGVSGMLIKAGESYGILYATHIDNEPFQRFSVAHELGHMFLPEHAEKLTEHGPHVSKAGFEVDISLEREADLFAACLLMPNFLFDQELDQVGTDLKGVLSLSELCRTSRTATAIQVIQRTSEVAAVVVSHGTIIDYAFLSDSLQEYPGINWPKKGHPVPKSSLTYRLAIDPTPTDQKAEAVGDFQDWFDGRIQGEILEEVIQLVSYGRTLTFITASELPSPDEYSEDEELEDSWKPKFGRR